MSKANTWLCLHYVALSCRVNSYLALFLQNNIIHLTLLFVDNLF